MHNFDLKMHVSSHPETTTGYVTLMMMLNHRPMQFTTTDSHRSAYADVLEHTSHTAYIKDSEFRLVFLSHALAAHSTVYKRQRWAHSKCFGDSTTYILHWVNDVSAIQLLTSWDAWKQSSWVSIRRRLSYVVALTGRDADHPHTHNSWYLHRPPRLHQSYTQRTQRPPIARSCYYSLAGGRYVGPPTATSNTLHNIQTDA